MQDDGELVDRILHIEEMKEELQEIAHGEMTMGSPDGDLPLEIEEKFLEHVLAFERAEQATHKEVLARDGVVLPPPEALGDEELQQKLGEVIAALAYRRTFLTNTNHLSDRELYCCLYRDILDVEGPVLSPDGLTNCHIDLVSSGSEEDIALWLTYYADEQTRADWAKDFPDEEIPPHQDPPYDRDRHLPVPPPPPSPYDDPEVLNAWVDECRQRLSDRLETDGLGHAVIGEDPRSYAAGLACVWAVAPPDSPDTADWWAISGNLPTTYLPLAEAADPRTFLRLVGQQWRAAALDMESGTSPTDLIIAAPSDWTCTASSLRRDADMMDEWADDDEAWEAESGPEA